MTIDEMIHVLRAYQDGKPIECKSIDGVHWSQKVVGAGFNFVLLEYRVAPEPTHLVKGYCFPMYIEKTPTVGMIKVEQVHLDEGENPIQPRKPREIWIQEIGNGLWQEKFKGLCSHFVEKID